MKALRDKCLRCVNGKEFCGLSGQGKGTLYISNIAPEIWINDIDPEYTAGRCGKQNRILNNVPKGAEDFLIALIAGFAALEIADVEIVHALLNGMRCAEIARAFGYKNRAAVHARIKTAMDRNPWLAELYTKGWGIGAKQLGRSETWKRWKRRGSDGKPLTRGQGRVLADLPSTDPRTLAKPSIDDIAANPENPAEAWESRKIDWLNDQELMEAVERMEAKRTDAAD